MTPFNLPCEIAGVESELWLRGPRRRGQRNRSRSGGAASGGAAAAGEAETSAVTDPSRTRHGPVTDPSRTRHEPVTNPSRTRHGAAGRHWVGTGQVLGRYWAVSEPERAGASRTGPGRAGRSRTDAERAGHIRANGTNARQSGPQNEHSVRAIKANLLFAKHVDSQNARPAPPLPHRAHGRRVAYHPLPRPGTKAGPRPGTIGLEEKNHHVTMPIACCDLAGNQPKRRLPFIARWLCKNDPL